jgi:hypothetical protein
MDPSLDLSVVVPVYNELGNLDALGMRWMQDRHLRWKLR